VRRLSVNEECEAFVKREFVAVGLFELLRESVSHSGEFQTPQFIERVVGEHQFFSFVVQ